MTALPPLRFLVSAAALGVLACSSSAPTDTTPEGGASVGDPIPIEVPKVSPPVAELCEIVFGRSSRTDIETVLGPSDGTRETSGNLVLLYEYADGVMIALHLDHDVFRAATLYAADYPDCWAAQEQAIEEAILRDAAAASEQEPEPQDRT